MTVFQSPLTMLLFAAAVILTALGVVLKKGQILSFFGGLSFSACIVSAFVAEATMQEILILAMLLLGVAVLCAKAGRREEE